MNRTLLLENLPDLLEDLDARLTALEAAEPQAQPVKISYVEHLAAEVKRLTAAATGLADDVIRLTAERNALAAQLDDLRNVNAGLRADNDTLRKDNERQSELIAALRQNSADLVESMKYLLSEAEPNKERMTALESLQDENATLRSRLAATSRQADEIKRLEAVCDDLSDKLDAANCR